MRILTTSLALILAAAMSGCQAGPATSSTDTEPTFAGAFQSTCGTDCTNPCCADNKQATQCGIDCTKPCCAGSIAQISPGTLGNGAFTCPISGEKIDPSSCPLKQNGGAIPDCCRNKGRNGETPDAGGCSGCPARKQKN